MPRRGSTISYPDEKSKYSKMKFIPPLPPSGKEKGRHGDIAKFYLSIQSKYTGKTSDNHSLAKHRVVYYAQCNIAQLNAAQGLECLINMINTQSLAGTFSLNEIFGQVPTLEEAFSKLFSWSRQSLNFNLFVQEWRGLRISHFQNDNVSWAIAMEKLYERASTLQDQLDDVHKHPQLLTEVLENAVQDQPFFLFVDRVVAQSSPQSFYHNCLLAIQKQSLHEKQQLKRAFVIEPITENIPTEQASETNRSL